MLWRIGATNEKSDGDALTSFAQISIWPINLSEAVTGFPCRVSTTNCWRGSLDRIANSAEFVCRLSNSTRGVDMFDANNH